MLIFSPSEKQRRLVSVERQANVARDVTNFSRSLPVGSNSMYDRFAQIEHTVSERYSETI